MISFRLSRRARILLAVTGPGPSCDLVGRVPIAGRAGLNRVRFNGTVRKVRLEPGTYLLESRLRAGGRRLGRTFVTIVDPESPGKRYARPQCLPTDLAALVRPAFGAVPALDEIVATVPSVPAAPNSVRTQSVDDQRAQVLGQISPPGVGASIDVANGGGSREILELVLLSIVIGVLISLVAVIAAVIFGPMRRGRPLF